MIRLDARYLQARINKMWALVAIRVLIVRPKAVIVKCWGIQATYTTRLATNLTLQSNNKEINHYMGDGGKIKRKPAYQ